MTLVGATALEDRLQDGVPECISELARAGLVIWVLTGDKEETAINISIACNLLAPPKYMKQIIINQKNSESVKAMKGLLVHELIEARKQTALHNGNKLGGKPRALVIDGPSLIIALGDESHVALRSNVEDKNLKGADYFNGDSMVGTPSFSYDLEYDIEKDDGEDVKYQARAPSAVLEGASALHSQVDEESSGELQNCCFGRNLNRVASKSDDLDAEDLDKLSAKALLLELSQYCKAVVACRVSPDQKRTMVNLIKNELGQDVLTLAIGDGANDVPMIKGAHIGVGIRGEEGQQAVNSADYAIAQFAFLSPLLLKHGRSNYVRMSKQVCYIFYKNVFMSVAMFWFNFFYAVGAGKRYLLRAPFRCITSCLLPYLFSSWQCTTRTLVLR